MRVHGVAMLTPKMGNGVSFYDTTIREQQNVMRAQAAANGWESVPKGGVHY